MSEEYIGWLDDDWNTVLDQSQPIVRCRDCKHFVPKGAYKFENGIVNDDFCRYMRSYMLQITPDGFCAWGKRKEGDEAMSNIRCKDPWWAKLDRFGHDHGWWSYSFLSGHIHIGKNITVYGRNAMHWGVDVYRPRKGDYLCFRLPLPCYGRWWKRGCYISPNATPNAATKWFWGDTE